MNPDYSFYRRGSAPAGSFALIAVLSLLGAPFAKSDLIHRWSFNNAAGSATDATVTDSIGGADGVVLGNGATFTGSAVRLPGGGSGSAPYVDLPNNLVSVHEKITIEAWVTVHGASGNWVRIFDFGTTTVGEVFEPNPGTGFNGINYLFLSASTGGDYNTQQLEIRVDSANNTVWRPDRPAAFGQQIYVVVTVDSSEGQSVVNYWRNNERLLTDVTSPFLLSQLDDVNNWLGRSNWSGDANVNAEFNEFRIYDHALSADEVAISQSLGPDDVAVDSDNDGMPDPWETLHGLNVGINDANDDADGDGVTNVQEFQRGLNPQNPDTDGDGLNDLVETNTGIWVSTSNTGTDPRHPDTDRDGLPDGAETKTGAFVDATNAGTDPLVRDTDGDGYGDGSEVASGSNPVQAASIPEPRLVHRWSFSETSGRRVVDAAGSATGYVHGRGFSWEEGSLHLDGGSSSHAAYVALPPGLISNHGLAKGGRGGVTLEGWATVHGVEGGPWARLVDFGTSDPGGANGAIHGTGNWNGGGTNAIDTFLLSAYNGTDTSVRRLALDNRDIDNIGAALVQFDPSASSQPGEPAHFVITVDESSGQVAYYENGVLVSSAETDPVNPFKLSNFRDINNWLGRSNYTHDGNLFGSFDEFRIYDGALPESTIAQHFADGPTATPAPPASPADTDGDGLPDWFERAHGLNPNDPADAAADPDGDGLTNLQEFQRGSSPHRADTDGDGLPDAVETSTGVFVNATDTGTHPAAYDTDGDFVSDSAEILASANPVDPASQPSATLRHRWSFNDPAGEVIDETPSLDAVTGQPSAIIRGDGAVFTGTGVTIPGGGSGSAAYVDLPNHLVSPLQTVTIEGWVSIHNTDNSWARIFDFGNTRVAPGSPDGKEIVGPGDAGEGGDYLFLSGSVGTDYNVNRFELREATPGPETNGVFDTTFTFASDEEFHFIALIDSTLPGVSRLSVWRNGEPTVTHGAVYTNLSKLDDVNNWLGRSNWTQDANLNATYNEFRIYEGLFGPARIAASYAAGPDAVIGGPPPAAGFEITSVSAPAGAAHSLNITTETGQTSQVETTTTLAGTGAGGWANLGDPIAGTGNPVTFTDTVNGPPSTAGGLRFYRVKVTTP